MKLLVLILLTVLTTSAASAAPAPDFTGRWAIDPQGCKVMGDTSETAPMFVTKTTIEWFVAACTMKKMYLTGNTLHVQARCSNEGKVSMTPIALELRGSDTLRVTWDNSRIKQDMRRCS
jgi:hypothetical protein